MDVRLPNGTIIKNVPEGTSKSELQRKAVLGGFATVEDFFPDVDIAAAEQEAVQGVGEELSTAEQFAVGAGRGLTNLGDVASQLFTSATGTDEEAEATRAAIERDKATFETGLGESTAASVGEFVGEVAPSIAVGGAAGLGAKALGTGVRALSTLASVPGTLAVEGAVGGAVVGAGEQAGESATDILLGAGGGAVAGGVTGGLLGKVGPALTKLGAQKLGSNEQNLFLKQVRDKFGDDVADLVKFDDGIIDQFALSDAANKIGTKDAFGELNKLLETAATGVFKKLGQAATATKKELKELSGKPILEIGKEVIQNLPGFAAGGLVTGTVTGALAGAAAQKVAGPVLKSAVQTIVPKAVRGLGKGTTGAVRTVIPQIEAAKAASNPTIQLIKDNIDSPPLAKYSEGLKAAKARSSISLASTIHVLSQTDPGFQLALKKLSEEEEEAVV